MDWKINDQEFNNVLLLPPAQRYEYFVKNVANWEMLWSLGDDDGWVLMGDNSGNEVFPVWPYDRYASACISGDWAGSKPKPIALDAWLRYWLPGLIRDGRSIAVFPTPNDKAVEVVSERLRQDLEEELSLY